jgi:hypothetical protein
MISSDKYEPILCSINADVPINANGVAGFICTAAGTISVYDSENVLLLDQFPMVAGGIYGIPIDTSAGNKITGGRVLLAAGARGTLLVQ